MAVLLNMSKYERPSVFLPPLSMVEIANLPSRGLAVASCFLHLPGAMQGLLPPLNDHNLPWMDTIHPIVVHFVIAMAIISVIFDLIGVLARKPNLFEVSFWNLLFATAAIFVAKPYGASRSILDWHSTLGWSLAGVLSLLTGWRYVLRSRDPLSLPLPFLAAGGVLALLVVVQVTLGNQLIWVYGLHTVPVVEAQRAGLVG
jgi:uncharacterized membrane protein